MIYWEERKQCSWGLLLDAIKVKVLDQHLESQIDLINWKILWHQVGRTLWGMVVLLHVWEIKHQRAREWNSGNKRNKSNWLKTKNINNTV